MTLQSSTNYGYFYNDGTNIGLASNIGSTGYKLIVNRNAPDSSLVIASTGAATFSSSVTAYSLSLTNEINAGQGRFSGWYTAGGGLAVEVGVSGGVGNVLAYNRSTGNYSTLALNGGSGGASATQIWINATGVGIGTTSPSTKLHIGGVGSAISFDTTGATATSVIQTILDYELSIKNNRGTSSEIIVGNEVLSFKTNSTERMRITSGGNLLVGDTTNSGDRLRVVGTDYNNVAYLLGGSTTGASYGLQIRAGSNSTDYSLLVQSRAGSDYFRIAGTGAATFSGDVKVKTLEITNVGTYGSSSGISTYMQITVNGQNYVIPLHGTP